MIKNSRPQFPKRAVITGGMPYGDKLLHFGHIGGVFIQADVFARFLRDRIGKENVIFVSGTDCYGSPIVVKYQKLQEEGTLKGSMEDFVLANHIKQKQILEDYQISLSFYGASGLGIAKDIHKNVSDEIFKAFYDNKKLLKLSTLQFYDEEKKSFLNGRQVTGRCPINNCQSEVGYADECALGHQYNPSDLINPISTLSGQKPVLKEITNWYFDLESYTDELIKWISEKEQKGEMRDYIVREFREFLKPPIIHFKKDDVPLLDTLKKQLGNYTLEQDENKNNARLIFKTLKEREAACLVLFANNIKYRTGKTLVPFRLTGNIDWGVEVPVYEDLDKLTFWVWPESLWAPISFTKSYLKTINKEADYPKWWSSEDAGLFQFIGEDNIYFYGPAEVAMFKSVNDKMKLNLPTLIANKHVLYFDKKASSSGLLKPPMAHELLEYYTVDQLRCHFLGFNLGSSNAAFKPKVYNPNPTNEGDPVVKEGSLLTNVFNRAIRTLFYSLQKYNNGIVPDVLVDSETLEAAEKTILGYELMMSRFEFHNVMSLLDSYIREINKMLSVRLQTEDENLRNQVLVNGIHMLKTAMILLHPIAPSGCEMLREYFKVGKEVWDWKNIFEPLSMFYLDNKHSFVFLEPRIDFFKKHESQLQ